MKMNIKKFGEFCGVSVRTLHYYDEIGLLSPDFVDEENGYRFYGEKALSRMQEILFYRELDFSLKDIKEILSSHDYNKKEALKAQKKLLLLKKERLQRIIETIESAEKGEAIMDLNAFNKDEFEKMRESYKNEAKERFGKTAAFKEHEEKTKAYSKEKWNEVGNGINKIMAEFSEIMNAGIAPEDGRATLLAEKLKKFITETQYTCTDEILLCLGEMYVTDERFKKNIDRNGAETAEYINAAIKAYCKK